MNRTAIGSLGMLSFALIGCGDQTKFRVEMSPEGAELVRSLSAWIEGEQGVRKALHPNPGSVDLDQIYDELFDQKYVGRFAGDLPEDLGGAGVYLCWPTEMGSAFLYAERVGGGLDPWRMIEEIEYESDRVADQLLGWLRFEFGEKGWFDDVSEFIDVTFRRDLRNFAFYARMADESSHTDPAQNTWVFLALQYALEAGYAHPRDLPRLTRVVSDSLLKQESGDALEEALPFEVCVALLPEEARESDHALAEFLRDPQRVADSFRSWSLKYGAAEDSDHLPSTPFDGYVAQLFSLDLFGKSQSVEMVLDTGVEPIFTNGEWDAANHVVNWPLARIDEEGIAPLYRTAVWVQPDEVFQAEHFGKTLLSSWDLWEYAIWRHGLNAEEEREWDGVLRALASSPKTTGHDDELPNFGALSPILEKKVRQLLEVN